MNNWLIVLGMPIICTLIGGWFHERDIVNSCREKGEATYAMWTVDKIRCEVLDDES